MKPQIDPRTSLWKDLHPLPSGELTPEQKKPGFKPEIRPVEPLVGIEITLGLAGGIPLPPSDVSFKRENVVKRAVRVGLFDEEKKEFVFNAL